jgi:hypothetical protein
MQQWPAYAKFPRKLTHVVASASGKGRNDPKPVRIGKRRQHGQQLISFRKRAFVFHM